MSVALLTDRTLMEIARIGLDRHPIEAVGIILPSGDVLELANRSDSPQDSFSFQVDEILVLLQVNHIYLTEEDWFELSIWHTHPGGNIGPSKVDVRSKLPHLGHLVVALTEEGPVPTWY